ncbi:MAG: ABC transporter ATP-binding protein [Bacteroidota bacterium]
MSAELILQTIDLGKRYKKRWAARGVNLRVHKGDVFGFLGPNGAGKSTTIRMLLSLIAPTTGRVELFGKDIKSNRQAVLSRVGGLVERADFYLYLSAQRNMEIVAGLMGGDKRASIARALEIVGLADRRHDRVKTYSHGMKQRLGIAQALIGNPEIVILDEPTTGLDPQGIKEVRELVRKLSVEQGITIFLSSHLLAEIEHTATSMAIINHGELVVQGKVSDLLNASTNAVRVDARPLDKAEEIIRTLSFAGDMVRRDRFLDVNMPFEKSSALNHALVTAGVEVHALIPRRSLEEYFLSITEGMSDVTPPSHSTDKHVARPL